ncbi:hypothetical protein ABPG74_004923 [Tetrahymena malaccensis]
MLLQKEISKSKQKEAMLFQVECFIFVNQEKKTINLQFFNSYLKILEHKSGNQIMGVVVISDMIRIEWLVKEGPDGVNAFDRCEGFRIEKDDIYQRAKAALEKDAASIDPLHLFNSQQQGKETKQGQANGESKKNSTTTTLDEQQKNIEQNDQFRQIIIEIFLKEPILLKKVYNYFAPRVIMKQFHDHYKAVKKLGKGSFASVYLVNHRETGKQLAIKAFLKEKLYQEDKGSEAFFNEINLMKQINHPHLLKLYEVWESMHSFYYVIELANGGSLMDRISLAKRAKKKGLEKEKDSGAFTENEIRQYIKQLTSGLMHLKERKIMHRDIKPDNILLRKVPVYQNLKTPKTQHLSANTIQQPKQYKYEAIIVDFGLGTPQDIKEYLFPKCGTPGYVAPEIINLKGDLTKARYTTQCDMFSIGATFYFMLSLKPLFLGQTTRETIELNKKCEINYNIPELKDCDKHAIDLMKKMLEKDPTLRIDPKSALKHPYFKNLDSNFEEELIVPEDTPTQIESVIKKFQSDTFDMSRINSLINSSLRQQMKQQSQDQSTCISNTSQKSLQMLNTLSNNNNNQMQPPPTNNMQYLSNTSCVSNLNSPNMAAMQESTHSDYESRSQYSNFKHKESINDSELNYVNKNQNVYGYISKQFISQSSFENDMRSPSFAASETSICRQESLTSNFSLKMKAHQNTNKQKDQNNQVRYRAQSVEDSLDPAHQNNLLNPNGAEGRTKSPSKFKIDFERSRASSDQFEHLNQIENQDEISKEAEQQTSNNQNNQQAQQQNQAKRNKAKEAMPQSKEENKLKFKKGTLDEQFYNDPNLL